MRFLEFVEQQRAVGYAAERRAEQAWIFDFRRSACRPSFADGIRTCRTEEVRRPQKETP
jgi:hypothetical protein